MWEPVALPELPGRVVAASAPAGDRMAVWTDAGVFILKIKLAPDGRPGGPATIHETLPAERAPKQFNPATGRLGWRSCKYLLHGACGPGGAVVGPPLDTTRPDGQTLERDGDRLVIRDAAGAVRQVIPVGAEKAAWSVAGYSGYNGHYLFVAHPGAVRLFRWVAPAEGGGAAWQKAGDPGRQQALLRAVNDDPDDDTPRLVYADWLEENGDPARAEFIRLACRLAEREQAADVPYDDPDAQRRDELVRGHAERWAAELPALPGVGYTFPGFRGFPAVHFRNPGDAAKHGDRVLAATPVAAVHFNRVPPRPLAAWLRTALPDRVERLTGWFLADGAEAGLADWLASPRAARLRRLEVGNLSVPAWTALVRAAAAARHLTRLEKMSVAEYMPDPPDEDAVLALARSPHLPRLRAVASWWWVRYRRATKAELRKRFPGIDLK